jgi:TRAP transporter 4TM/12TM fusion protein
MADDRKTSDPASQTPPLDDKPREGGKKPRMSAEDVLVMVEAGAREPKSRFFRYLITGLCLAWSMFQLYVAYQPIDSFVARAWHLAFAICLAYLAYPAYKQHSPPLWVDWASKVVPSFGKRSIRKHIPVYDIVLALLATAAALYVWWDYRGIITRQGMPSQADIIMGTILIVLLLEAARRALGPALSILALCFLLYVFAGPYMPEVLRHRGVPLDFIISDMYLSTTGIFGVPLGVSVDFVFLFVLFGALLDKAGGGKYFIDVAFSALGTFRGGPAKAAVLASGMMGMVSGSSIANTVTTGTFTIPLMKRVGFPAHKAAAVEVACSTNGQLMPPIMGAAAFIMAEIIGLPYIDVIRAALFPAIISYLGLFFVVHLESLKLGIKAIPRSELPRFVSTFLRGCHFLIPLSVLIVSMVVMRRTPIASALFAVESLLVIMLVQRPIIAFLVLSTQRKKGELTPEVDVFAFVRSAFKQGLLDIWNGLLSGARNMISVGVATATAGIIVGVVTITGLVGQFITLIDTISMGNVYLMLIFTAMTCLILGMGMPTTANYIIMATLTAPVIVQLGGAAGLVFPLIAAHLFVFYFGILADDTPPVGLAAYAGAAIARTAPIKTGIQGFIYDMRTAILPFIFLFNTELLMISGLDEAGRIVWIDSIPKLAWILTAGLTAMFAFVSAVQGYLVIRCNIVERLLLLAVCLISFRPGFFAPMIPGVEREILQAIGFFSFLAIGGLQWLRARQQSRGEAVPMTRS